MVRFVAVGKKDRIYENGLPDSPNGAISSYATLIATSFSGQAVWMVFWYILPDDHQPNRSHPRISTLARFPNPAFFHRIGPLPIGSARMASPPPSPAARTDTGTPAPSG
jgi:hypothetical protein